MAGHRIAARMKDYFGRQIALFETMLVNLETIEEDLGRDAGEGMLPLQSAHEKGMRDLGEEFRSLQREWEATQDLSDDERSDLGNLARRADTLCAELQARLARGASVADEGAAALRESIGRVRLGKDLLGKYGPGDGTGAAYIDRKA